MRRWMWIAGVVAAAGTGGWYATHRPSDCSECQPIFCPMSPESSDAQVAMQSEPLPMPRLEAGFEESDPPELIDLTPLMFPAESEPMPKSTGIPQIPEPKFEAATGPTPLVPEFLPYAVEAVSTPTPVSFRDWWDRLMAKMVRPSPANLTLPSMLYPRTAQPAYHPGCTYEGGGRNSVVPAKFDAEEADAPPKLPWWKPRRTP